MWGSILTIFVGEISSSDNSAKVQPWRRKNEIPVNEYTVVPSNQSVRWLTKQEMQDAAKVLPYDPKTRLKNGITSPVPQQ